MYDDFNCNIRFGPVIFGKHRQWTYVDLRVSVTFACLTASGLFAIQSGEVTVSLYFIYFFPSDIRPPAPLRALSCRCAGGDNGSSFYFVSLRFGVLSQ